MFSDTLSLSLSLFLPLSPSLSLHCYQLSPPCPVVLNLFKAQQKGITISLVRVIVL